MLTSLLNTCTDCGSLEDALCELDGTIAYLSKNVYQNLVYLTNKKTESCDMARLIFYKEILLTLKANPDFYCSHFTMNDIVSRARALVAGTPKIAKRWVLPVYTTTSTSTTTTTTT